MNTLSAEVKKTNVSARLLVSFMLAVCYGLVFFTSNTPLGPAISSDNAMYLTMGTAIAKGFAPYTEIFDHKGPLLFLLQTFPQLFSGGYSTLSVFCQEVLFLFACLTLVSKIADALSAPAFPAQLCYLALGSALLDGGNLTEEYAAVFTLAGLYVIVKTFGSGMPERAEGLFARAALLGAMTMLAFMTRANNALVLLATTAVFAVVFAGKKQFALLGRCAGGFTLGLLAAGLPVAVWLAANGALKESIYGSIIHNMMYAETGSTSRVHTLLFKPYGHRAIFLAAVSCLGALTLIRKNLALSAAMVMGAAAAGFAAFISHKFYNHYLYIGVPLAAFGSAALLGAAVKVWAGRKKAVSLAVSLACCIALIPAFFACRSERLWWRESYLAVQQSAEELYALVPEEDRDSFLAYRAEPMWYVAAEALPSMRFYFLQEILADADPAVMDEIVDTFDARPPKWLVIYYNREFGPPYDARVQTIFDTRYEFVAASGTYQLLKLREAL